MLASLWGANSTQCLLCMLKKSRTSALHQPCHLLRTTCLVTHVAASQKQLASVSHAAVHTDPRALCWQKCHATSVQRLPVQAWTLLGMLVHRMRERNEEVMHVT